MKDISKQRFGSLVAIEAVGSCKKGVIWKFACDCGKEVEYTVAKVDSMKYPSCGCWSKNTKRVGLDIYDL